MTLAELQETKEYKASVEWIEKHGPQCLTCVTGKLFSEAMGILVPGCSEFNDKISRLRAMMRGAS